MNVRSFQERDYDDFDGLRQQKNKANLPAFGRKSEVLNPKLVLSEVEWIRNKLNGCGLTEHDFKKQSQFAG